MVLLSFSLTPHRRCGESIEQTYALLQNKSCWKWIFWIEDKLLEAGNPGASFDRRDDGHDLGCQLHLLD